MPKGDEAALIAGAVAGRSYAEIATAADGVGFDGATAVARSGNLAAVRAGRSQQRREAVGRLNSEVQTAIQRLGELQMHEDPKIALRAVGMVLGNAHKFTLSIECEERLQLEHFSEERS